MPAISLPDQTNTLITQSGYCVQIDDDSLKDRVSKALVDSLSCQVCLRSFQRGSVHRPKSNDGRTVDSVITEHVICKSCCQDKSDCPICRRKITAENLTGYSLMVREPIDRLMVHCPSEKCAFTTELVSIDAHIKKIHGKEGHWRQTEPELDFSTVHNRLVDRLRLDIFDGENFTLLFLTVLPLSLFIFPFILNYLVSESSTSLPSTPASTSSIENRELIQSLQELRTFLQFSIDFGPVVPVFVMLIEIMIFYLETLDDKVPSEEGGLRIE